MRPIWNWLKNDKNRDILKIAAAVGVPTILAVVWAVMTFAVDQPRSSPHTSPHTIATSGGIAIGDANVAMSPSPAPPEALNLEMFAKEQERQRQQQAEGRAAGPLIPHPESDIELFPPCWGSPQECRDSQILGGRESSTPRLGDNTEVRKILELGKKLDTLPKGDIVLDAPKAMKVDEKRQVDANVGINVPIEVLQKKSHAGNQQFKGQARISSEMIATLSGPGFKIDAITPERQAIAEGFPTVWSWNVEAKDAGDQELEATLYALGPVDILLFEGDSPLLRNLIQG